MQNKHIRRVAIVNFTGTRGNWGCQSTSWELLKFLNSAFPGKEPPEVCLIPLFPRHRIDREMEKDHLENIYDAFLDVCQSSDNGEPIEFLERICSRRYGPFAEAVKESDIVFFQAEGTMAGTDFLQGARLVLLPFVAKHAWGKTVYSLNQTIVNCDDRFGEIYPHVFNSFDFVSVRENISFSAARRAGIKDVFHIPDAAFLTQPVHDERLPELSDGEYFAVSGSAFFSPDIHQLIIETADAIRKETGLRPLVVSSAAADKTLNRLASEYWSPSEYRFIPSDVSYTAAAFALKQCRFLFGGRYHMTIVAAAMGVPSIQVRGNSYKNEGLSAMLGGLSPVRELTDPDRIVRDAMELHEDHEQQAMLLANAVEPIAQALEDARSWFADTLSGLAPDTPPAFREPPGQPIDCIDHIEPYCTSVIARAQAFAYPDSPRDGLSRELTPQNLLLPLIPSALHGDKEAQAALRQIEASYPDIVATAGDNLKAMLGAVKAIGQYDAR